MNTNPSIRPKEPFSRISVAEAKKILDANEAQIIDTRTPGEYMGGHVPGAINIPHMSIIQRKSELDPDRPLLFICATGHRSALACEFAASVGFGPLSNIEGGTEAWIKAGYGTE